MHKTFTWNITYIHLIYSQKLIVKPEVIDSLIRAIAIKLTRRKKKYAPPPFHLPLKLIPYITDPRSRSWSRKNETKKKETNPETKPNILPLHHLATPSLPPFRARLNGDHHISLLPPPLATPFSSCMQRVQAVNKENDDDTPPLEVFGKLNINEARRKWQSGGVHVGSARAGPRCVYECGPIRLSAEEDPRRKRRREHTWQVARNRATRVTHTGVTRA